MCKLNFTKKQVLNPDLISIYDFNKDSDYCCTVGKVEIGKFGFNDENFSEVSGELYNESVDHIN